MHLEDQLSSEKKCGHLGGKVLIPTQTGGPVSARGALGGRRARRTDACSIARTDANGAQLITSDVDPRDREFLTGERTPEGFYGTRGGLDASIARGLSYAPYCDLIWVETSEPDLDEARRFAEAIHAVHPGQAAGLQLLALVQLEEEARRRDHRALPRRVGRDGVRVPVHHAGRLPRAQPLVLRAVARFQGSRDERIRGVPSSASSQANRSGTPQRVISARSGPDTSMKSRRP